MKATSDEPVDEIHAIRTPALPESVIAAIGRQLPKIDIEDVQHALDTYVLYPFLAPPDATFVKSALGRAAGLAQELSEIVREVGWDAHSNLSERMKRLSGMTAKRFRLALDCFGSIAMQLAVETEPNKGRPQTLKRNLVQELARLLKSAGYEVSAKPSGPLVYLTTEVLAVCHDDPGDVRSLVRNTLRS